MTTLSIQPLTAADRKALAAFLSTPGRSGAIKTYHGLQGLLFAVVCAPEMILPSEWLDVLFGDDSGFSSLEEADQVMGWVTALHNETAAAVFESRNAAPPSDCGFRDAVMENLEVDAPISQWASGFLKTHLWLGDLWQELLPDELEEELDGTLLPLAFFASQSMAEKLVAETSHGVGAEGSPSLEDVASSMRQIFPTAAQTYARIGRSIERLEETAEAAMLTFPTRASNVGRNEPCPCGSGKKYKKCCGAPGG